MNINKDIFTFFDSGTPTFTEADFPLDWSMTRNEKFCFLKLLELIRPEVAIEIGVEKGGSLQVLSKYAEKVYAIEIDQHKAEHLKDIFNNVEFLVGDSKIIIPQLLDKIKQDGKSLEFALIDGDHSEKGVKTDIENLIKYIPQKSLNIILHDSFNPDCRRGMTSVNYTTNKHVHYVELDYISGTFEPDGLKNEMWGGFGHIVLLNEERTRNLEIKESQKSLFRITQRYSKHYWKNKFKFLKSIKKTLKK